MARSKSSSRASLARQATVVALFVLAALLGILTGVLVAYTGDLPQVSALDEYKPSTITRVHARDGRVIGEYATQRRVILKYRGDPAAHAPSHPGGRGRRVRASRRHPADAPPRDGRPQPRVRAASVLRGREHAHAAAHAQALPQAGEDARAEGQGGRARPPDREALHQAGDLHALLQPDEPRPRRVWRRGRGARVFRQAGEGPVAGRGRDDRGHPAAAGAPEPVRQPEVGDPAPQLHAAAHGRGRVHHGGAGRGSAQEAHRARRPARPVEHDRALFHRGSPAAPRTAVRRAGSLRGRALGPDDARLRPPGGRGQGAGSRAERPRQAPRLSQAVEKRRGRRQDARRAPRAPVGPPDPRGRRRARRGDGRGRRHRQGSRAHGREERPGPAAGHRAGARREVPKASSRELDSSGRGGRRRRNSWRPATSSRWK